MLTKMVGNDILPVVVRRNIKKKRKENTYMKRREIILTVSGICLGFMIIAGLIMSEKKNYRDPEIPDSVAEIERLNPRDNVVEAIFDLREKDEKEESASQKTVKTVKKEKQKMETVSETEEPESETPETVRPEESESETPAPEVPDIQETGWTIGIY